MAKKVLLSMAKKMRQSVIAIRKDQTGAMIRKRKVGGSRKTRERGLPAERPPVGSERPRTGPPSALPGGSYWLFGRHAIQAALANPKRRISRLVASTEPDADLSAALQARGLGAPERLEREEITRLLPPGAVHQSLALACRPLSQPDLESFLRNATPPEAIFVVLDQMTDPQNVGAILRSAAAFGAAAILNHDRPGTGGKRRLGQGRLGRLGGHPLPARDQSGTGSGSSEAGPTSGVWALDEAGRPLNEAPRSQRIALVMGAEGNGLRRLTKKRCDALLKLPTRPPIGTLNVSNAAAIALYELCSRGAAR